MKRVNAFTFAEIMIALLILGVILVFTVPTLVANYKIKVTSTKVGQTYALLSQSFAEAKTAKGTPLRWNLLDMGGEDTLANKRGNENWFKVQFKKNFKILKNCETSAKGCMGTQKITTIDKTEILSTSFDATKNYYKFILNNGSSVAINSMSRKCKINKGRGALGYTCGEIIVDLDGPNKGRNVYGEDLFKFYLTKSGVSIYNADVNNKEMVPALVKDCISTGESCTVLLWRYGKLWANNREKLIKESEDVEPCLGDQIYNSDTGTCECPEDTHWDGSTCASCPTGQIWDGSACNCPPGQNWNGTTCITCPEGQEWSSEANACVCSGSCSGGKEFNSACACVCPPETVECGGACVANSCSGGRTFSTYSCSCECASGTWNGTECVTSTSETPNGSTSSSSTGGGGTTTCTGGGTGSKFYSCSISCGLASMCGCMIASDTIQADSWTEARQKMQAKYPMINWGQSTGCNPDTLIMCNLVE